MVVVRARGGEIGSCSMGTDEQSFEEGEGTFKIKVFKKLLIDP